MMIEMSEQLRGARRFGCQYCEAFCLMKYQSKTTTLSEVLWNSRDAVTPYGISMRDGSEGLHADWHEDRYAPNHTPKIGDRIFVNLSTDQARAHRTGYVERYWDDAEYPMRGIYPDKPTAIESLAAEDVKSFGIGTTPHVVVVDEWILADLLSRRCPPAQPYTPRKFA